MKFMSLRELRVRTAEIRKELQAQREVILTANGKPIAILAQVDEDSFEDRLKVLRRASAQALLDRAHADAKAHGVDKLTMDEINAEIAAARRKRKAGQ